MPRDRRVDVGGRCFAAGQRERGVGRGHQHVDLVDVQRMGVLVPEPERPREGIRNLHDEHPIGIGARAAQFGDRPAGVQRQGAPAVGVRRRRDGRHHARCLLLEQRPEAAKVGRGEFDVGAHVPQRPLERTVEAG